MSLLLPIAGRLGPLLGKLGSDHDGEILAAARAIGRELNKHGLNFNDLGAALQPEPVVQVMSGERQPGEEPVIDWLDMAEWCAEHVARLDEREADFVTNMCRILRRPGSEPTPRQARWLQSILDRICDKERRRPA